MNRVQTALQHADHILYGKYPLTGGGFDPNKFFVAAYDANDCPIHKETGISGRQVTLLFGEAIGGLVRADSGTKMPADYPENYRHLDREAIENAYKNVAKDTENDPERQVG